MKLPALFIAVLVLSGVARAEGTDYSYAAIAKRYAAEQLTADEVAAARMHGECLIGLKELNFRSSENFDPVAEWTNYRSLSLLEQFPPCNVLIMMEVARAGLLDSMEEPE